MKIFSICLLCAGLLGCATPIVAPKIVKVPVPVYCSVNIPAKPSLAISKIGVASTDSQIARDYVESLIQMDGYGSQLRLLLATCSHSGKP
jgi:hypothetical protein